MTVIEHEPVQAPPQPSRADILRRAADLLEEFGWCQGTYAKDASGAPCNVRDGEAFCMTGALARSVMDLSKWESRWTPATGGVEVPVLLILRERGSTLSVMGWNDCRSRTKKEVVSVLREAAERA